MSSSSSSSPRQPSAADQGDESKLPSGHCRYILVQPELRGRRCGCTHFNLNRSIRSATCDCGHLACYHVNHVEPPPSENKEMEALKQRLMALEREHVELHQLRRDFMLSQERVSVTDSRSTAALARVSQLEELVERNRTDASQEVRSVFAIIDRAWDSIAELDRYKNQADTRFRHVDSRFHSLGAEVARLGERQFDLVDDYISLQERIDAIGSLDDRVEVLENMESLHDYELARRQVEESSTRQPVPLRSRRSSHAPRQSQELQQQQQQQPMDTTSASRPPSRSPSHPHSPSNFQYHSQLSPYVFGTAGSIKSPINVGFPVASVPPMASMQSTASMAPVPSVPPTPTLAPTRALTPRRSIHDSESTSTDLWTVHISLMPTATQPFPFERDTNAYKRLLSRGLHQMVGVQGSSAAAIDQAIKRAFHTFMDGEYWVPLKAVPCTAEFLAGLPMLRQLDPYLLSQPFDQKFLRDNCAVCDINGKIDSLYIAMPNRTLSWHLLRRSPVITENLEPCWEFDPRLDGPEMSDGESSSGDEANGSNPRPPAGDIVATLPSLKRAASEMSRSSSFGSATATAPAISATSVPEGEGSRPKVPRIYPLPNVVDVRRGVKIL